MRIDTHFDRVQAIQINGIWRTVEHGQLVLEAPVKLNEYAEILTQARGVRVCFTDKNGLKFRPFVSEIDAVRFVPEGN